jgi:hypothetical protein
VPGNVGVSQAAALLRGVLGLILLALALLAVIKLLDGEVDSRPS